MIVKYSKIYSDKKKTKKTSLPGQKTHESIKDALDSVQKELGQLHNLHLNVKVKK